MNVLSIDQSTSATKAILFDRAGKMLARSSREHKQIYPRPGWVEHDAEEIWRNLLAAVGDLPLNDASVVSITNQRETAVVFDRATGRPLHHALVWQDRRGESICRALQAAGNEPFVSAKTGLKIDPYFSASKLAWLMQNDRDLAGKISAGDALIGTIDTYLIYRLTGGSVFATDHTNASRTLLFDIHALRWDERLCELFGVPMCALPEVRDSTARFGETTLAGTAPQPLPICGVMGDSQAALFAQRCFKPGMAKVTLGSGSSVLLTLPPGEPSGSAAGKREFANTRESAESAAAVTAVAWTHGGDATYCLEGIINYTGATIAWLKDQLGLIDHASETESAALGVPDNGGVYLVPAFAGLSAPHWSPAARAAILGLSAHSDRRHVIRAALESIAYQIRDVLDAMQQQGGVKLDVIHADGGATRNRFLMQFIADMTGRTIAAADVAECSPLGAAMAGMLGLGTYKSLEELAALPRETQRYQPAMNAVDRDRFYAGWQRAVKQVLAGADAAM